ncbi:hypothetical protein DFH28DRAFT_925679 [Melampsora americana]|nr:hypothetical protein DFH28DRAFT_925679 [Melampsora americana]
MSVNNIESTTARLNALESTIDSGATHEGNSNNPSSNTANTTRASLRIETGPSGPTYNKQALISSYLGRGKDTVAPRQTGPLEGPNKRNNNSKQEYTLPTIVSYIRV